MNRIRNKIREQSGETIGETLVALLIASLALVMLAGAISSGAKIILKSKAKMDNYYVKNNAISSMSQPSPPSVIPVFKENDSGTSVPLTKNGDEKVSVYVNDEFNSIKVISYMMSETAPGGGS